MIEKIGAGLGALLDLAAIVAFCGAALFVIGLAAGKI
jgi:hypothetical protein